MTLVTVDGGFDVRSIGFSLDRSVGNLQMTLVTVEGAFDLEIDRL